jgi:predicted molibdopterin-dependent oxidoreductase YjgC
VGPRSCVISNQSNRGKVFLGDREALEFTAKKLNLTDGETVQLRSRHGEVEIPIRINDAVKRCELVAIFQTPAVFLNRVTSPYRDRHTLTAEYKVAAVRIDKL